MYKEDALLVFEGHIRELYKEHDEEKIKEQAREKREHRRNRDNMLVRNLPMSVCNKGQCSSVVLCRLLPSACL